MKLTEFLQGVGRPVAYYPSLRKLTGSTTATILLCQLFYWTGKEASGDGWIYKSSDELAEETGLSYDEQVTARKNLVERELIEEDYKRLEHKMYFRVCTETINTVWEIPETGNAKMGKAESRLSLNGTTENTTENTTQEIKPEIKKDMVDGLLEIGQMPGAKTKLVKEYIFEEIKRKLGMNPSGKDAESFINYAAQEHKKGHDFERFLSWWIENNPDPIYWSFRRMEQMHPRAFVENKASVGSYTFLEIGS
jgi:hypothetical protein